MKIKKRILRVLTFLGLMISLMAAGLTFTACREKVSLRFETNGGTRLETVEGVVGMSYTIPQDPEKEGYYFDGWYLTEDFTGERQELPDTMPKHSTTYYAKYVKYPVLKLSAEGGTLLKEEHLVKPGVLLTEYLKDYVPEKQGLIFGGWYKGDELIGDDAVMTEGDLTLTARYKAEYAVNIYLQKSDSPKEFERSEELSIVSANWEGATLAPEIPAPLHYHLDESREIVKNRILRAGENILEFYYLCDEVKLTYITETPSGERKEEKVDTRYGAHITLETASLTREGYTFFGWANNKDSAAQHFPDETLTMGEEDIVLYGTWAQCYPNARGTGKLTVEEHASGGIHSAVYMTESVISKGEYNARDRTFKTEGFQGKLDDRGYCLMDDSGNYLGYKLLLGRADASYGTLLLDFASGSGTYALEGKKTQGSYEYEWDEQAKAYTGKYRFYADGVEFLFVLNEKGNYFLREGTERGSYALTDGNTFSRIENLKLDGFGAATLSRDGELLKGSYRGAESGEGDWQFEAEGARFRFLTVEKSWSVGTATETERGYLVYNALLWGEYAGYGSLKLDGYGCRGEYISLNGVSTVGRFTREGVFVTLYGKETLRFTLQGSKFSLTGDEAGTYTGEKGALFLDGAGGAVLSGSSETQGSYASLGGGEYTFMPARGEPFRFKADAGQYRLFKESLYGNYSGRYGNPLCLDGYGGGTYTTYDNRVIQVSVGYYDGDLLEVCSSELILPLYFRIKSKTRVSLVDEPEVGRYFLTCNGVPTEDYLVLNGDGAKLVQGGKSEYGDYSVDNSGEVRYYSDTCELKFLLTVRDGLLACVQSVIGGTYAGNGTLVLDGYDKAKYTSDNVIEGTYSVIEGGIELLSGDKLYRFKLGTQIESVKVFTRYSGAHGDLYLQKNGSSAILMGATREEGSCTVSTYYTYSGGEVFKFKLSGSNYLLYDEEVEATYHLENGGTLKLDGCGNGTLKHGEVIITGGVEIKADGLIVLSSSGQYSVSGKLAFERTDSGARLLGAEYGEYQGGFGETLLLDGKGGGVYCGVRGSYTALEGDDFVFQSGSVSVRFRLLREREEALFEIYSEALNAHSGTYETEQWSLEVTAYGVTFSSGGTEERLKILYAGTDFFVAQDEAGTLYGFHFGEENFFKPTFKLLGC